MTKTIEYIGPHDVRTVRASDFSAAGVTHADVTWNRANAYEADVADDAATFLLAFPSQFQDKAGATLADLSGASPARAGGIALHPAGMEQITPLLAGAGDAPIDVVLVGDSIWELGSTSQVPYKVSRWLAPQLGQPASYSYKAGKAGTSLEVTTQDGTDEGNAFGYRGAVMAPGDIMTLDVEGSDGVSFTYETVDGGLGEVTVRDGVGGTVLGNVSNDNASEHAGNLWTSAVLTEGDRTYEFENTGTGNVTVGMVYSHSRNVDQGVRIWNATRSGASATAFGSAAPSRLLDFVEHQQPAVVVLLLGTNTTDPAEHATLATLVDEIVALSPLTKVVGCVTYKNAQFPEAEVTLVRDILEAHADVQVVVDYDRMFPEAVNAGMCAGDNVHPSELGKEMMALSLAMVLSGDPLNTIASIFQDYVSTLGDQTIDGLLTTTGNVVSHGSLTAWSGLLSFGDGAAPGAGDAVIGWDGSGAKVKVMTLLEVLGTQLPNIDLYAGRLGVREQTEPSSPDADHVVLFAVDNGGSTELKAKFANGTVKTITTDV